MNSIYNKLCTISGSENVIKDADMARFTTFRAGGKADYLVNPGTAKEISELIRLHKEENIKYYILGNGSNVLVRDEGFHGTIIRIGNRMDSFEIDGNIIRCQAGTFLSKIANGAAANGLTGMEFAAGIPGSIGGAAAMNAGAYGGEMKDIINNVKMINKDGEILELDCSHLNLSYRNSIILSGEYVVTDVVLELMPGDKTAIREKMEGFMKARREKQPLEYPSAGSTFKRPEGYFAGKLIMDAGLAGFAVNDAEVSEKHCGFVINKGKATATDIINLMNKISEIVFDKSGVRLEPEVRIIG